MPKLSVFVTTFNNARTLPSCLASVAWADEIVLLDSYSDDETLAIAREHGCRVFQHRFLGYGAQKQLAMEHTHHDWVLLLDADEALSPGLAAEIREVLAAGPRADGYELPRREQMFWRMCHPGVRPNYFLRLFDKRKAHISNMPVHAAPKLTGTTARLHAPFYHYGDRHIHAKVERINGYSTGLVADKLARGRRASPWILIFYPPLFFLRSLIFKRNILNGWVGFISAACGAFYVFLKYAKLYEYEQYQRHGADALPPGAPPPEPPPTSIEARDARGEEEG